MEEKALIIDIPTSNVGSIKNAIFDLGFKSKISSDLEDIKKFNKVILLNFQYFHHFLQKTVK